MPLIESQQAKLSNRDPDIRNRFELGLIGQYGIKFISDTGVVTIASGFCRIHALADAVIDTLTGNCSGMNVENGGATVPLKAGDDIIGDFTAIKLASGIVYLCLSRELNS